MILQVCNLRKRNSLLQWRIQDLPQSTNSKGGGAMLSFGQFFPKNCMKLIEIGPGRGHPLSPLWIRQWSNKGFVQRIQESIPVGYVPPSCRPYAVVSHVSCIQGGDYPHAPSPWTHRHL